MKNLWAPWRMEYILQSKTEGCIFCQALKKAKDEETYILYRGSSCFVILNIFPYNNGHIMVVPNKHTATIEGLDQEASSELIQQVQMMVKVIKKAMNPDGFNIGINLGKIAGVGVEGHVHVHIVPRWEGDTNFMPVTGETKVLPEFLRNTYAQLLNVLKHSE